jgi:two-component sensor histidine kinase
MCNRHVERTVLAEISMRIFVADDDPDTRALVARALCQEFSDAVIREIVDDADLNEALIEATADMLITDYDLRWTDGLDIFQRIKTAHPECCVIMFTGTGNEELAVRALKSGFDDYIVKAPKQFKRLATSARAACGRAAERRKLRESKDLLLKELYHRLHNNLQLVISLMRLTEASLPDATSRNLIKDLGQRIQSLALLQEQFYHAEDFRRVDFRAFLQGIISDLHAMGGNLLNFEVVLEDVEVPVNVAVPLGLIANELVMNVIKHAFPENCAGRVTVLFERKGNSVMLLVADNGIGLSRSKDEIRDGLGTKIISRLATQIDAEISFESQETGTQCRVTLSV